MRKLERGPAPRSLSDYRHGHDNWGSVSAETRTDIWNALEQMQGSRCAYCEAPIVIGNRHIEHFQQRGRHPALTFAWTNLFGSCNREESCGKHKDRCGAYPPNVPLKPDIDDPDDFLVFVSDGTIVPRAGLSASDKRRAEETLRIFNLDAQNGALRHIRRSQAAGYLQTAEELQALATEYPPEEWLPLLESELEAIEHLPFSTTIRHALIGQSR